MDSMRFVSIRFPLIALMLWLSALASARPLRIGIYTGTFDPPHSGHVELVRAARDSLGLDLMLVIPNCRTGHKPGATPYQHRRRMTELALVGERKIDLLSGDMEKLLCEEGIDAVMKALLEKEGSSEYFRILGDDSFQYYLDHPDALTSERLTLVYNGRSLEAGERELPQRIGKSPIRRMCQACPYSSTEERRSIRRGAISPRVPERVGLYIRVHGLYIDSCPLQLEWHGSR